MAAVSPTEAWAVGEDGLILHLSGGKWQLISSPTRETLNGVSFLTAEDGWAVGANGTILHYGGGKWQAVGSNGVSSTLEAVQMVSADEGWIAGGRLLHYSGGAWSAVEDAPLLYTTGLSMLSPSEGWAVGERGTIMHYKDSKWTVVSGAQSLAAACAALRQSHPGDGHKGEEQAQQQTLARLAQPGEAAGDSGQVRTHRLFTSGWLLAASGAANGVALASSSLAP